MDNNNDWIYEELVADENGMINVPKERYDNMRSALFSISVLGYLGKAECFQCNEIDDAFQYAKKISRGTLGMQYKKRE